MDNRIAFDVYATLKDPHFRVEVEASPDRVEVVFGGPSVCDEPANVLNLWLTDPDTVVDLGQELIKRGRELRWEREDAARSTEGEASLARRSKCDSSAAGAPDEERGDDA